MAAATVAAIKKWRSGESSESEIMARQHGSDMVVAVAAT